MGRFGKTVLLGGIALTLPVSAMATDIPPPPTYYYPPPPPVEEPSNWYLRLDLGYKIYRQPSAEFDLPGLGYFVPGTGEFINEHISATGLAGIGFGWDPQGFFRADVTLDYEWPGYFTGWLECVGCGGPPQYSVEWARISALTLLLNGYADFDFGGAVTPYIGAGVGVSRLWTSNVSFLNPDGTTGTWTGAATWNLAWAAMAGVGIEVSPQWTLDINYRYVHLGNAIAWTSLGGGTPINYNNINAHEIRFGIRLNAF